MSDNCPMNSSIESNNVEELIKSLKSNIENETLLVRAGENNLTEIKSLIPSNRVNINYTDKNGNTALHYAVMKKNEEVINYLLECKAEVNIGNFQNKTPFDIAVDYKNDKIIESLGWKIVSQSCDIIKTYEGEKSVLRKEKFKNDFYREIKSLRKYLEKVNFNDKEPSYETAIAFIMFLEIFNNNLSGKEINICAKNIINGEEHDNIIDTYKLTLKNKNAIQLEDIKIIIESFYDEENIPSDKSKVSYFFCNMKEYLDGLMNKNLKYKIKSPILKKCSYEIRKKERSTDKTEAYDELKSLLLNVFEERINWQKYWFDFVVNIYFALGLDEKQNEEMSEIEKQLKHLRTKLIHQYCRFSPQLFVATMLSIRTLLFEYLYFRKVRILLSKNENIEEIEENLKTELENLQKEFNSEKFLSEKEEAKSLFGHRYKSVKSSTPTGPVIDRESDIKQLVEEYFKFMFIVEDMNRKNRNINKEEKGLKMNDKALDNKARRQIFISFVRLMQTKQISQDSYEEEKENLMCELKEYGISENKLKTICEYYLDHDAKVDENFLKFIDNVVKFITNIVRFVDTIDNKEKGVIFWTELILSTDIADEGHIFWDNSSLKNQLIESAKKDYDILQVIDPIESCRTIDIKVGDIIIQINTRKAIKNMLGMFYYAYNEARIDYDVENLFCKSNFLSNLMEDSFTNFSTVICTLIDKNYMSPFIAKLIEKIIKKQNYNLQASFKDKKSTLMKLMSNLSSKKEYAHYLNIILNIEFDNLDLHKELYDDIIKKKVVDIDNIRCIFQELKHLEKFIDLLKDSYDAKNKEDIAKLARRIVKILNKEASKRLFSSPNGSLDDYDKVLELLNKAEEIPSEFKIEMEDFIDLKLLMARIKIEQNKNVEALEILNRIKEDMKADRSVSGMAKLFITLRYIATAKSTSQCTHDDYIDLYNRMVNYVLFLDKPREMDQSMAIVSTIKEDYDRMKKLRVYKSLLHSSDLLRSAECLDILDIAGELAQHASHHQSKEHCEAAIIIHEAIYAGHRQEFGELDAKSLASLWRLGEAQQRLGDVFQAVEEYGAALTQYQLALLGYNVGSALEKKIYDSDQTARLATRDGLASALGSLAGVHTELGNREQEHQLPRACEHYKKAQQVFESLMELWRKNEPAKQSTLNDLRNIARVYAKLGEYKLNISVPEAVGYYTQAANVFKEVVKIQMETREDTKTKKECNKLISVYNVITQSDV